MQPQLIGWLNEQRKGRSIRSLARDLGVSHAYVSQILKGEKPLTWGFCATVAERMNVPAMTVFEMAGLLPQQKQQ